MTSRANSPNATMATSAMNASSTAPPMHTASAATASMTTAESSRLGRSAAFTLIGTGSFGPSGRTELPAAIASLPCGKARQRLLEMRDGEIGPQHLGEPHLGVGRLPKQEIRQPYLARC